MDLKLPKSRARNPKADVDRIDIAILEILQESARMPVSELGRRVGLSQPAVSERVKRLEERGVITGYGAHIDPAALGFGMMAIIRLKTTYENIRPCLQRFNDMPHVIEVHRLTGEDCFLLKVVVPSPGELEAIVDSIARFGDVTTSLVLRSEAPKPFRQKLIAGPRAI